MNLINFHSLHLFYFAASYCLHQLKYVSFKSECVLIKVKHYLTDLYLDCGCNIEGSISLHCNSIGKCPCKEKITGNKCSKCHSNHSIPFPDCTGKHQQTFKKFPYISNISLHSNVIW